MKWIDWEKFRHEWKTFAIQMGGLLLGLHEAAIEAGADWTPFVPEKYRDFVLPVAMTASLLLRKYNNKCSKSSGS